MSASQDDRNRTAFSPDPQLDLLAEPERDVAGWSENMFFQGWDGERGIGLFTHIGRVRNAPDIWRCVLAVYLPGGKVLAHRSYGKAPDRNGPATGSMSIRCKTPGKAWSLAYDGVAEHTDSLTTAKRVVGAGPSKPLRITLEFAAISPTYDLFAARGLGTQEFAHMHHEQAFTARGSFVVDGESIPFDGMGFRDHSVGARDLTGFFGNILFFAVFPDGTVIQALRNYTETRAVKLDSGFIVENGKGELLQVTAAPILNSSAGDPAEFEVAYERDGKPLKFKCHTLHNAAFTISLPNDWSVGVDTETPDPLIILEQPIRVEAPDGQIGYGNLERNFRRSTLRIPS